MKYAPLCALLLFGMGLPAAALAQDANLDRLRREIEAELRGTGNAPLEAIPERPGNGQSPAAPTSDGMNAGNGFEPINAVPPGYGGPTAKVAVGTIAQAVVNMTSISDYPGPWRATLTQPIMNIDRSAVIAPTGSTLVGVTERAQGVNEPIHNRMLFTPIALVLPDSRIIPLVGQYQVDGEGVSGVRDRVDYHLEIQAAAIGGSSIADALPSVIASALGADKVSRIRDNVVENMSDSGKAILEKYASLVPTVEIRPGALVNIFFMRETVAPVWRAPEPYSFQKPRR